MNSGKYLGRWVGRRGCKTQFIPPSDSVRTHCTVSPRIASPSKDAQLVGAWVWPLQAFQACLSLLCLGLLCKGGSSYDMSWLASLIFTFTALIIWNLSILHVNWGANNCNGSAASSCSSIVKLSMFPLTFDYCAFSISHVPWNLFGLLLCKNLPALSFVCICVVSRIPSRLCSLHQSDFLPLLFAEWPCSSKNG